MPTRQKNALCQLQNKPTFSPEEVADLSYRMVERAAGVGMVGLALIRIWLGRYGLDLQDVPICGNNGKGAQRVRKIERAIDYLRGQGYEVRRLR